MIYMLNDPLYYSQNCMAMSRQEDREREREIEREIQTDWWTQMNVDVMDTVTEEEMMRQTYRMRLKELTLSKHCVTTNQCPPRAQATVIMQ